MYLEEVVETRNLFQRADAINQNNNQIMITLVIMSKKISG